MIIVPNHDSIVYAIVINYLSLVHLFFPIIYFYRSSINHYHYYCLPIYIEFAESVKLIIIYVPHLTIKNL